MDGVLCRYRIERRLALLEGFRRAHVLSAQCGSMDRSPADGDRAGPRRALACATAQHGPSSWDAPARYRALRTDTTAEKGDDTAPTE
jgi:hypothetical protein